MGSRPTLRDRFGGKERRLQRVERLHAEGVRSPGTLVGIQTLSVPDPDTPGHPDSDSTELKLVWRFAVEVEPATGPAFRGCFEHDLPEGCALPVRLGMPVEVLHLDGLVTVDWAGVHRPAWREIRGVPDGITDPGITRRRGTLVEADVLGARGIVIGGVPSHLLELRIALDGVPHRLWIDETLHHSDVLLPGATLPLRWQGRQLRPDWALVTARHGYLINAAFEVSEEPPRHLKRLDALASDLRAFVPERVEA